MSLYDMCVLGVLHVGLQKCQFTMRARVSDLGIMKCCFAMCVWQTGIQRCKVTMCAYHVQAHKCKHMIALLASAPTARHKFKLFFTGGAGAPADPTFMSASLFGI